VQKRCFSLNSFNLRDLATDFTDYTGEKTEKSKSRTQEFKNGRGKTIATHPASRSIVAIILTVFSSIQQHSGAIQSIFRGAFYDSQNVFRTMPATSKNGQKPHLNADFADSVDLKKRKISDTRNHEYKNFGAECLWVSGTQAAGCQPRYSVVKEQVWLLVSRYLFPRLREDKPGSRKRHKTGEKKHSLSVYIGANVRAPCEKRH
jgi:hypothetical protein